jgi:stearoyl-CoA desaturase (delta-9 desaturase)
MKSTQTGPTRDFWYWLKSVVFASVHGIAMIGAVVYPPSWTYVGLAAAVYVVLMLSVTIGYHRYFAHKAYKAGRVMQFVIAWFAQMSTQKGVLWWAAHHRSHHRYSDQEQDPHSPKKGFWWSHVGWILDAASGPRNDKLVSDLLVFPELRWLSRWYLVPPMTLLGGLLLVGGWSFGIWGYVIPTVIAWHATFTINSLSHIWGSRVYETDDTSRNNPILALLTFGEGWHNNHHYFQVSARQGFVWWEFDLSYYFLCGLEWCGLIYGVKRPTARVLAARGIGSPKPKSTEPMPPSGSNVQPNGPEDGRPTRLVG